MAVELDYVEVVRSFVSWGCSYSELQLRDHEWLVQEIGRKGFGITVTHETVDSYLDTVARIGKADREDPAIVAFSEKIRDAGGFYIYQIRGESRRTADGSIASGADGHESPVLETLHQALLVALSNICRINWLHGRTQSND